jgi:hypothetical protein
MFGEGVKEAFGSNASRLAFRLQNHPWLQIEQQPSGAISLANSVSGIWIGE